MRPSKDIVREAIFNILRDISGFLILDIYAGTGILGFEALSRGARHIDYVEKMRDFSKLIQQNAITLDVEEKLDIFNEKAEIFLKNPHSQTYDLIFLDPPYKHEASEDIESLVEFASKKGILIYLHSHKLEAKPKIDKWEQFENRTYGKTTVSFYQIA